MSYKAKFFEWDVNINPDQVGVPVGYEFEFYRLNEGSVLYNLSTFRENAVKGSIFYSFDGVNFIDFPLGEEGVKFYTDYTMRVKIVNAMRENVFAVSDGIIYRLTGDCTHIIERFDTGVDLSMLSVDNKTNNVYSYYDKTLFCFGTADTIRIKKSFNLGSEALEIIVDGSRGVFWQVQKTQVLKRSLENAKVLEKYLLGSSISGNVRKFLNKRNGNVVISAQTLSGYEIFELDYYSDSVSSDTSANLILDIGKGNSGYFVVFGNQYLGRFDSGTLDETYLATGRTNVTNISGDMDVFYLIDEGLDDAVKFSIPYTEEWSARIIPGNQGFLKARGNDSSVIYSGGGLVTCLRDEGVEFKRLPINDDTIAIDLASQTMPSHTAFRYRAVYGEADLDQSSSSSSQSSSSSSLDSSSSSSDRYSTSSISEVSAVSSTSQSTQSQSTQSESTLSGSSLSSPSSSSSSENYSESSSSISQSSSSQSESSSLGNSESSSSGVVGSDSSSSESSITISESSSSFDPPSSSSDSSGFLNWRYDACELFTESISSISESISSSSESIGNTSSSESSKSSLLFSSDSSESSLGSSSISSSSSESDALDQINCEGNSDPRVKMTLCWSGPGLRVFLREEWENGESKIICPSNYWTSGREVWRIAIDDSVRLSVDQGSGYSPGEADIAVIIRNNQAQFYVGLNYNEGGGYGTTTGCNPHFNVDNMINVSPTTLCGVWGSSASAYTDIRDIMFGKCTVTSGHLEGVTIKWEPISGSGQPWGSWKNGSLNYVPTTGNENCP